MQVSVIICLFTKIVGCVCQVTHGKRTAVSRKLVHSRTNGVVFNKMYHGVECQLQHRHVSIYGKFDPSVNRQEAQLMLTTGSTRLAVSRGQQTWYHSTCYI